MKYSTFFDIMIIDYRGRLIMEYIIEVKNLEKKYILKKEAYTD